jgi:cytochrome-b5 reductase
MSLNDDCDVNNDNNDDNRPKTPLEEDCCGSGCTPCVFDIHRTLLREWENRKLQKLKIKPNSNLLSLLSYKTFIITNISKTSEEYFLICLEYPGIQSIAKNLYI